MGNKINCVQHCDYHHHLQIYVSIICTLTNLCCIAVGNKECSYCIDFVDGGSFFGLEISSNSVKKVFMNI